MDRELAMVCAQKLAETFNLILLDKENIDSSVSSLSDREKIAIIQSMFSMEKGNIKSDILTCNQTVEKHLTDRAQGPSLLHTAWVTRL